jgi:hypothetical protein
MVEFPGSAEGNPVDIKRTFRVIHWLLYSTYFTLVTSYLS